MHGCVDVWGGGRWGAAHQVPVATIFVAVDTEHMIFANGVLHPPHTLYKGLDMQAFSIVVDIA